ncbi:odorant receptor 85c-like isoform X2 [Pectinophora gossypiella]|nr:odorant receptor 85c-like isoform X2 [Pectinophora gossypiella]
MYMINGIFFNNRNSKIRYVYPMLNTTMALIASAFQMMFMYRGVTIEDYAFASESFCYVVILGTAPLVYISTLYNTDIIITQLNEMDKDFIFISSLTTKHRDHFLKGQLIIWQLCLAWFAFCTVVCGMYIVNTFVLLFHYSLIATQDEHMIRPLIFPMWLPEDDPYRTPNYEIFMFFQIVLISIIYQNFCGYVYIQFHILIHYYTIMDVIILDFEDIFDDLDESVVDLKKDDSRRVEVQLILNSRMKRIVQWHISVIKSLDTLSSVYGPPLVYQVMFSSVAICIMAYQVVNQLENGKVDFLFAMLWFGACVQLWIPCYLGTLMRDKGFAMADACWYSGWSNTKLSIMLRNEIVLFISKTQQPLIIKFTALPNLTLETFSSIMSSSYSYFNMLRQSTKD